MKKTLITVIILALSVTLFAACNDSEEVLPPAEVATGGVSLLSGYPENILPLYNSIKIESVGFSVRGDYNYVFGKDIYTVRYLSSASTQDAMEYYRGLATSIDDEYSTDDSLMAEIGENPMGVYLTEDGDDLYISLTLGMKPSENVSVNPYFSDYPGDLIEPFGRGTFSEQGYEVRELNGTEVVYTESYITNSNKEAFREFYSIKYGEAENLEVEEDEYGLSYRWTDRGFTCIVSISTYNGPGGDFVSTTASKNLN